MGLVDELCQILGEVLQLGDRANSLTDESLLLGEVPEFDSMAVVSILTRIEEVYGFEVDDDEMDATVFESVGTLAQYVKGKLDRQLSA